MVLKNHIAYSILDKEDILIMQMIEESFPGSFKHLLNTPSDQWDELLSKDVIDTYFLLRNEGSINYIVTNSVLDMLDYLKVEKEAGRYDWTVFSNMKEQKCTFILPGNRALRMVISQDVIWFCHFERYQGDNDQERLSWIMFYFNRETGERGSGDGSRPIRLDMNEVDSLEPFVYRLLCFMFLTENDEIELKPGQKTGTKKSGKVINTLSQNIIVVNSRWNTTTIRTEGFKVSGHFRLQKVGQGRQHTRMIFIEPFQKHGYIRRAKSLQ